MIRKPLTFLLAAALAAGAAYAANQIARSVVGSGGLGGTSASFKLDATVGQAVVGTVSATTQTLRSGFWTSQGTSASVDAGRIPATFHLDLPSPNPFHDALEIRYGVPAAGGPVNLRIYDVRGRLVRTLLTGPATPGRKTILWNGRDQGGGRLPLGIYLLSFDAPGYSATRKIVLTN